MSTFLIKVEDSFEIKGRGLILAPPIPEKTNLPDSAVILLVCPDGSFLETEANFEIPFIRFSRIEDYSRHKPAYEIVIKDLAKADIPIGTEIWIK